uniref:Integrin beta-1-binding protein 2 isoform 1 n=1 Tax=Sus scrofa TaxID=9823 RepID=A0A480QX70_PIG
MLGIVTFPSLILLLISTDSCCHHPGVPVFHDALKGWSCCRKRTVDFSEFLNIKGCTVGPHCAEKLPEAPQPEGPATSSSLLEQKPPNTIPKSAETLRRERPKSDLPPKLLPLNISQALEMALEQKELDQEPGAGKWVLHRTGFGISLMSHNVTTRHYFYSGCGSTPWLRNFHMPQVRPLV